MVDTIVRGHGLHINEHAAGDGQTRWIARLMLKNNSQEKVNGSGKTVPIKGSAAATSIGVVKVTVWQSYSFAPEWFHDAQQEARKGKDHNARRREIVFAVSAVESYLVEWVRDEVLERDFGSLTDYFPPHRQRGIVQKWKQVTKQLAEDGKIPATPSFGEEYWTDFIELVTYRHGLVHARASRPGTYDQADDERPLPSKKTLDEILAGWATRVAASVIRHLHEAVGTEPPPWLADP